MRRVLPALLLALSCLVASGATQRVEAHAYLVRSDPGANQIFPDAPPVVQLWFTEEPELRFSQIEVYNTARVRVQMPALQSVPEDRRVLLARLDPLAPGVYTVVWRALSSVDGHTTVGAFAFGVGLGQEVTGPVSGVLTQGIQSSRASPVEAAVRWLAYLSFAGVLGGLTFIPFVLEPALASLGRRQARPVDRTAQTAGGAVRHTMQRAIIRLAWWGWWGSFATTMAAAVVQTARAAGMPLSGLFSLGGPLITLLLETRYGQVWFSRVLFLVLLGLTLSRLRPGPNRLGHRDRTLWYVAASFAALFPLTLSLTSHAAAVDPSAVAGAPFVPVIADWVHLLATGVWVGGLLVLVFALPRGLVAAGHGHRLSLVAALIPSFSTVAIASVAALTLTGVYQSVLHVGSVDALRGTDYGRTLLLKLVLVVPLVLLGAFNLIFARPRLARAEMAATDGTRRTAGDRAIRTFSTMVSAEALLATAVLLVVGVMTLNQPAKDAWADLTRGITLEQTSGDLRLRLRVDPGTPGFNAFALLVRDRGGRPVSVEKAALVVTMVEHDMGQNEVVLTPEGNGRYTAEAGVAGMVGTWHAEAVVRRTGREDVRTRFEFVLSEQPAQVVDGRSGTTPGTVVGPVAPAAARVIRNPVPPTEESLAIGKELYTQNCLVCHGVTGRGDGPAARALRPPPADLAQHVTQHSEGELWWWITNGVPGTQMPAWRNTLSDEQRWHVLNYLVQAFGPTGR
jgi:copper transport protein